MVGEILTELLKPLADDGDRLAHLVGDLGEREPLNPQGDQRQVLLRQVPHPRSQADVRDDLHSRVGALLVEDRRFELVVTFAVEFPFSIGDPIEVNQLQPSLVVGPRIERVFHAVLALHEVTAEIDGSTTADADQHRNRQLHPSKGVLLVQLERLGDSFFEPLFGVVGDETGDRFEDALSDEAAELLVDVFFFHVVSGAHTEGLVALVAQKSATGRNRAGYIISRDNPDDGGTSKGG